MSVRTSMPPVLGPHSWQGNTRLRTFALLLSVVAALAAASAGAPVGSLELGFRADGGVQHASPLDDPCSAWWRGPSVSGVRAADVLEADVACTRAALAARALALEFDPVR